MKLSPYMESTNILMNLSADECSDCLIEMIRTVDDGLVRDRTELISATLSREQLAPTGIGNGIAIPHTMTDAIKKAVLLIGRSRTGIDFFASDGRPARLIFLVLAPRSKRPLFFSLMSAIIKLMREEDASPTMLSAGDPADIIAYIRAYEHHNFLGNLKQGSIIEPVLSGARGLLL